MNVGLYHEAAGGRDAGGIARFVQELGAALAADHTVYLYTRDDDSTRTVAESDLEVVPVPTDGARDRLATAVGRATPLGRQGARKLLTFASAHRDGVLAHVDRHCDVLFTHQYLDDLLCSRATDVPVVFEYHGLQQVGLGTLARERLSSTEWVVANSAFTARQLRRDLGRDVDGIVRPGVDVDRFAPVEEQGVGERPSRNGDSPRGDGGTSDDRLEVLSAADRPVVLFVGRLVADKGPRDLLRAASRLSSDAQICVVGRGDVAGLREVAARFGVADDVTFAGPVPHQELPAYYRAADVVCNPTRYESYGMVNLEALASGTALVTTPVGGITEYATDGETAVLVPPDDPKALADGLESVLDDAAERDRLASDGRAAALDHNWERRAEAAEQVLARAADGTVPATDDPGPGDAVRADGANAHVTTGDRDAADADRPRRD